MPVEWGGGEGVPARAQGLIMHDAQKRLRAFAHLAVCSGAS